VERQVFARCPVAIRPEDGHSLSRHLRRDAQFGFDQKLVEQLLGRGNIAREFAWFAIRAGVGLDVSPLLDVLDEVDNLACFAPLTFVRQMRRDSDPGLRFRVSGLGFRMRVKVLEVRVGG
jgi:hypothetical protein